MTHHPSFSSALEWDPNGGTVYVAIGQVKDIVGPALTRGDIDVSDHDSTSGYREFLPGLTDPGTWTFTIGFDPNNTAHTDGSGTGLVGDFLQDGCDLGAWEYTLNTCGSVMVWTADGYVNGFTQNAPVEGEVTADISVKISGVPTLTIS